MSDSLFMLYGLVAFGVWCSVDKGKYPFMAFLLGLGWPVLVGALIGEQFRDTEEPKDKSVRNVNPVRGDDGE